VATVLALINALPRLLQLIQLIAGWVRDAEQRGIGRKEAIAEGLEKAHRELAWADAEEAAAMQSHAKAQDDSAFDEDFQRKD
jgi:hypothetical protein